jgi:hypothetical protein
MTSISNIGIGREIGLVLAGIVLLLIGSSADALRITVGRFHI